MRAENIEVTLKIPFREVDCNGFEYSESAIKEACKKVGKVPIRTIINDKVSIIGESYDVLYDEENKCTIVKGIIYGGGTCESVNFDENDIVDIMKIKAIGITE